MVRELLLLALVACAAADTAHSVRMREVAKAVNEHPGRTWTAVHPADRLKDGKVAPVAAPPAPAVAKSHESLQSTCAQDQCGTKAGCRWDFRTANTLRPVEDQGQCGACVAFATTHAWNDAAIINDAPLSNWLSPQSLVSCCSASGCGGCTGNDPRSAMGFYKSTGIAWESSFPYYAMDGVQCQNPNTPKKLANYLTGSGECNMISAMAKYGAITSSIQAYEDFMNYPYTPSYMDDGSFSQVYSHTSGSLLGGHSMELVGYGVNSQGVKYWIAKNSFGMMSGYDGYYLIRRGTNEVGIESRPYTVPVLSSSSSVEEDMLTALPEVHTNYTYDGESLPMHIDNPVALEAAQFAARSVKSVHCSGDAALQTIGDVSAQVVSGVMYRMTIVVGGANCSKPSSYYASVYYNATSGNFTLHTATEFMTPEAVEERSQSNSGSSAPLSENWQIGAVGAAAVVVSVFGVIGGLFLYRRRQQQQLADSGAASSTELSAGLLEQDA